MDLFLVLHVPQNTTMGIYFDFKMVGKKAFNSISTGIIKTATRLKFSFRVGCI